MVNEFPELQGIAGRYYAQAAGEPAAIADAIDEAYMPRFAGDAIAPSKLGQVVAIAERLDTLAGGFAAGLKPTGNKDPFALRRNALGLARTIIESGMDVDLIELLRKAQLEINVRNSAKKIVAQDAAMTAAKASGLHFESEPAPEFQLSLAQGSQIAEIFDFVIERLRGYYADESIPTQQFNAVAEVNSASLFDFDRRIKAIAEFAKLPEAEALAAANKRSRNILKKVEGELPSAIDPALFNEPAERELAEAVDAAVADTDPLLAPGDYVAVLGRLARLRPQVDAFFDQVMVNVDDSAVRNNRLALLKRLSDRLGSVAAIEHLSI